jgi:hydroxylysine kinase
VGAAATPGLGIGVRQRSTPAPGALTSAAARVPEDEAERIAAQHYGISASARRLPSEKDDNFALVADADAWLLKLAHPEEPADVTNLATAALLALDGIADVPVQRVIATTAGDAELVVRTADGSTRRARMTSFLEGRILRSVPTSAPLRENLGRVLARLGQELKGFEHPAGSRPLLWDLWQADQVRLLLDDLDRLDGRELLIECLDRFEAELRPRLGRLRRQMIHNDLSGDNVLVADDGVSVAGILDFGDAVVTQLINDVAVLATNLLAPDADPLAPALDLVRGYHRVVALTEPELALLYDLVRLRITIRIVVTEWRSLRFPENREYIMRNTPGAWKLLRTMPASGAQDAGRRLMAACGLR